MGAADGAVSTPAPVKLSPAQKEVLATALRYEGRVRQMSVTTKNILKDRGLIEIGQRVKDVSSRLEHSTRRDELIKKAADFIHLGDWIKAYSSLGLAYGEQGTLDATCYWITDEGRRAVGL